MEAVVIRPPTFSGCRLAEPSGAGQPACGNGSIAGSTRQEGRHGMDRDADSSVGGDGLRGLVTVPDGDGLTVGEQGAERRYRYGALMRRSSCSNGCTGTTTGACSDPSGMCLRLHSRHTTTTNWFRRSDANRRLAPCIPAAAASSAAQSALALPRSRMAFRSVAARRSRRCSDRAPRAAADRSRTGGMECPTGAHSGHMARAQANTTPSIPPLPPARAPLLPPGDRQAPPVLRLPLDRTRDRAGRPRRTTKDGAARKAGSGAPAPHRPPVSSR